jgi:predicted RNA-binding Zn-ribbon protein involved in translation (DUF1610 family)
MWYHVREGDPKHKRIVFRTVTCVRSKIKAYFIAWNLKEPGKDVWVVADTEHADDNFKQFKCPDCGNLMSRRELDSTWDWGGPHCNVCGCTGMTMFSAVTAHKPIITGYQVAMGIFKRLLGDKFNENVK